MANVEGQLARIMKRVMKPILAIEVLFSVPVLHLGCTPVGNTQARPAVTKNVVFLGVPENEAQTLDDPASELHGITKMTKIHMSDYSTYERLRV